MTGKIHSVIFFFLAQFFFCGKFRYVGIIVFVVVDTEICLRYISYCEKVKLVGIHGMRAFQIQIDDLFVFGIEHTAFCSERVERSASDECFYLSFVYIIGAHSFYKIYKCFEFSVFVSFGYYLGQKGVADVFYAEKTETDSL